MALEICRMLRISSVQQATVLHLQSDRKFKAKELKVFNFCHKCSLLLPSGLWNSRIWQGSEARDSDAFERQDVP
jgi:hypothetical protein